MSTFTHSGSSENRPDSCLGGELHPAGFGWSEPANSGGWNRVSRGGETGWAKTAMRTAGRGPGLGTVLVLVATACAWGGLIPPLYVGNLEPVRDQYGRPMIGSSSSGFAASRSRLEIHTAPNGVVWPPAISGTAHPDNPLLAPDSFGGVGMNADQPNSGLFCMIFPKRPAAGTKIFGRAFNAPTPEEASFYADSFVALSPSIDCSLVLVFGSAQPLDPGDDDGDSLINSWEKALGIDDRPTGDYDGDGMGDYHEMLAGTAPDDPDSRLEFRDIRSDAAAGPAGEGGEGTCPVRVKWQTVPGKSYQLQYLPTLQGEQVFIDVGPGVTAGEGEYEIQLVVDLPKTAVTGAFRVKLVLPEN